jgi:tRNA G18 (ribose-2'-O)-methylase SpoU
MSSILHKLSFEELKSTRPSLEELHTIKRFPVTVLLENIRSLYNVGSIFRTSDGACVERIFLCGYTGYPPRKEIEKTALGSTDSVPWVHEPDTMRALQLLKSEGYQLVALEHTDMSVSYREASFSYPLCLVLGNEVEGITDETVSLCDMAVAIPMYGIKQSLNVSVAYGIAVYHIIEQYGNPGK